MTQVIEMSKVKRRAGIARLTRGYSAALANVMESALLDDGTHTDPETGEAQAREFDRTEKRHSAVISLGEFFVQVLRLRLKIEERPWEKRVAQPGDLGGFCENAHRRVDKYREDNIGAGRLVVDPVLNARFLSMERDYVSAIFTALQIEMRAPEPPDEAEFWADVFRGFADADPSGVVLRAAGLVLLDHLDAFRRALAIHSK